MFTREAKFIRVPSVYDALTTDPGSSLLKRTLTFYSNEAKAPVTIEVKMLDAVKLNEVADRIERLISEA